MKFNEILKDMRAGKKARRTDWGYAETAYITIELFHGIWNFFMNCQYIETNGQCDKIGYGLTFTDIDSDTWEIFD